MGPKRDTEREKEQARKRDLEDLQSVINDIKRSKQAIQLLQTKRLGLEVSITALSKQVKDAESDEDSAAKQALFKAEQQKLTDLDEELADQEMFLATSLSNKRELENKISDDSPTPRPAPSDPSMNVVQGGQIAAIPTFDGVSAAEAEKWIRMVDRYKQNFGWTSKQTAATVRNKLTGEASLFVDNNEDEGVGNCQEWDEHANGLRAMLLAKFGLTLSATTTSHALDDLQQGPTEMVDPFYERVRYAVTKFLTGFGRRTVAEKASYSNTYGRLVYNFFKAGIYASYRQRIFSAAAASHPPTHADLLAAARGVELEAGKSKKDVIPKAVSAMEVTEDKPLAESHLKDEDMVTTDDSPSKAGMEEMKKELDEIKRRLPPPNRGRGRGRGRRGRGGRRGGWQRWRGGGGFRPGPPQEGCHNCGAMDHWVRECPKPRGSPFQRGAGNRRWPRQFQEMRWASSPSYGGPSQDPSMMGYDGYYQDSGYESLN